MSAVAVLDHGKTHARLTLADVDGGTAESWATETPVRRDGPYPAEDAVALEPFVLDALANAARLARIDAVIPVAHGAAGALIDGAGLALPILDYEHDGPEAVAADYAAARPPFAETFSPALPLGLNLGRQLWWQARRFPDAFARARAFLPLPQYWAWRLSGIAATEATSLGAHTDLWAPLVGRPSSMVADLGWDRLFPPRRSAWDALGPVAPRVATATGLDPATPVLTGLHDSNASLLPHLGAGRRSVVSTGTWIIVMHVGGATDRLVEADDMLANVDALGRPTPSARFMGGREYAAIADGDAPPTLEAAGAVVAAGALATPAFSAQGGPWRGRAGAIVGEVPATPGARSALASLYCALVTDDLLDRLGADGPVAIDGPFARNPVYVAALAALRGGVALPPETGAPMDAALLARWGAAPPSSPDLATAPAIHGLDLVGYRALWRAALGR